MVFCSDTITVCNPYVWVGYCTQGYGDGSAQFKRHALAIIIVLL